MARTVEKEMNLSDLPVVTVDNKAQENKKQEGEHVEVVNQNKENETNNKDGDNFKMIAKKKKKIIEKLKYLVNKLKTTHYSETIKNTLKQYVLAEPQARRVLVDIIMATNDKYFKIRLRAFIQEMNEEALDPGDKSTPIKSAENNNQPKTPETGTSSSENYNNGRRRSLRLSKHPPGSLHSEDKPAMTTTSGNNNQPKTSKTPTSLYENDNKGRRRSLRLSTHPPGYFQTKPAMVFYILPDDTVRERENTSRIKKLTHTVPKIKRRKLYNPNSI
nr:uncharacterized protein LOC111422589 isoform X2 [Onthophagus taurus]